MSNPQLENGYTKIANEILDNLAKIRIPGEARQMLDLIIRKTYGFNKKSDGLATSQIMAGTGLGRRGVERARAILRRMNLITTVKNDGTYFLIYSFNKHFRSWVPTVKKDGTDKNRGEVPTKTGAKYPPKRCTQKTTTKEIIQKKEDFEKTDLDGRKAFQDLTRKLARGKALTC